MSTLAGTVVYRTVVTIIAASSGDGDTIAAMFNGLTIPTVATTTTATATNSSGTVTLYWPQANVRGGNSWVLNAVSNIIAADAALTSPVTATVTTLSAMTA